METETPTRPAVASAAEFVAEAARVTNDADVAAAAALYAADATMRVVFDGAEEVHRGKAAIESAWRAYFPTLHRRGFRVRKALLAADAETIVNDWHGTRRGGADAFGVEVWRFNERGEVVEHLLTGYLDVRPATNLLARLRLGLSAPILGAAVLRAGQREAKRLNTRAG